jgi:bacteriocin biosynthesis cyclodehydratase domain-containing protein
MTKRQLPTRPRIVGGLPVLRRRQGELQIGLDARHATVVDNLTDTVVRVAQRLTGQQTVDELIEDLSVDDRTNARELLKALHDRGLLEDATNIPPRLAGDISATKIHAISTGQRAYNNPTGRNKLAIAVHGDGRLAVAIASLLAVAGVGWVHVSATGTVKPEDTGTGYRMDDVGVPRHVAARRVLRQVASAVRTTLFTAARGPDLVILADALVPRPEQLDELTAGAVPHLLVRMRDTVGIVGPLVVPGMTSCLRCADLHRCDRDACWPHVATQIAGHAQLADLASTHATAAFAVTQALDAANWLRGGPERPATCEVTVELDLWSATARHRGWSAHPACPCGAAQRQSPGQEDCAKVAANTATELRQSTGDGDAT